MRLLKTVHLKTMVTAIGVMGLTGLMCSTISTAYAAESPTVLARADVVAADFCKVPFSTLSGAKLLSGGYAGQCKGGLPEGQGTATFANGDSYQGAFALGKIDGKGTWTTRDGSSYAGQWRDGKRHGVGTYQWGHGSTYAGDWFYDRRHGMGTLSWPSGDRFEGEFRNNKYYAGTFYTASGNKLACMDGQCR